MAVELSIACGDTDLNRALLSGAVFSGAALLPGWPSLR
jgi:hypothetical protein